VFVLLLMDGLVVGARTAGHAEDSDEERHRHQRRPDPFLLFHRVDFTEEVDFHFHNCVFRLLFFCLLLLRTSRSQIHCITYYTEEPRITQSRRGARGREMRRRGGFTRGDLRRHLLL
jgi:hypothetical protein